MYRDPLTYRHVQIKGLSPCGEERLEVGYISMMIKIPYDRCRLRTKNIGIEIWLSAQRFFFEMNFRDYHIIYYCCWWLAPFNNWHHDFRVFPANLSLFSVYVSFQFWWML
jgi:hypothetical protein